MNTSAAVEFFFCHNDHFKANGRTNAFGLSNGQFAQVSLKMNDVIKRNDVVKS